VTHPISPLVPPDHPRPRGIAHYLALAERFVLIMIAIVLSLLALLLLASGVQVLVQSAMDWTIRDKAIEILDTVLLVMMTMEIVYTVTLSLESHTLVAEPFLVIGAIAAIRRILVITAETSRTADTNTFIELFLLAFIVIVMALSIYILRRSQAAGKSIEEPLPE
jgi:phosphate starvation-inducible membrane PsiE